VTEAARRSEASLRRAICDAARELWERGHGAPGDGNLSVRLDAKTLLCTPSGAHKGKLRPADVVKLRFPSGEPLKKVQKPSLELKLHLALYAARAEVNAVVHAHSPCAVALTVAGVSMAEPVVPEAVFAFGSIPTVPYASPTTGDVPAAVLAHAAGRDAFLLARHGPVTLGRTLEEAMMRLYVVEHTARITLLALAAGGAAPLPKDELAKLRALVVP
jgi:L-fuculose-phosphate aldolase